MYEGGGDSDTYELQPVHVAAPPARASTAQLVMPVRYHRALDAFLQGRGGSQDSDSDSESESDIPSSKGTKMGRRDSLESLMKEKKAREGTIEDAYGDGNEDLEAQPAWMRTRYLSENNVLRRRLALPTIIIILLVILAAFFAGHSTLQSPSSTSSTSKYLGEKKRLSLQESLFGTYWAETKSIDWLGEAGDGVYSYKLSDNSIMLHDLTTNTTRRLVEGNKIMNDYGIRLDYSTFQVSPDLRYILFSADRDHVWRWSSRSNFWIHDLEHSTTVPLIPKTNPPTTAIAKWAPKGHSIAYVQDNDLYISTLTSSPSSNNTIIRITNNGNETIFNGVPDWVYEEEVFSSDSASWWSPDGKKLAFLSFDESEVNVYSYPVYNPGEAQPGAKPYPDFVDMRYPKPGTPNPKVSLHLFDLSAYESGFPVDAATYSLQVDNPLDAHDRIITEVAWVGDSDLIIKETNRAATRERVAHFDFSNIAKDGLQGGIITRDVDYVQMDGGWAPAGQRIHGMQSQAEANDRFDELPEGYLDVIPDKEGYMHLALFSPANAKEPLFLTTGQWEIDGVIQGVDLKRRLAYFIAANPSIERHIYSVSLPTKDELEKYKSGKMKLPAAQNLTDTSSPGFYDASFSPQAGFHLLGQKNGIPWQKVHKVDDPDFHFPISNNADLKKKLGQYVIPKTTFSSVEVNNVSINVAATFPPNLDVTGRHKYPVLLRPYGGPNSQTVQNKFKIDWTHYLASEGYIVLEIDGRGTGFQGRKFKSCIRGNLGELEAMDQIAVAEWYRDNHGFVDPKRIGIQGWSYGGYLTAKVIETNTTAISLGMSVAPVTDWRYYDTIYTERYMDTLETNPAGYVRSSVRDMEGFKHADYLLLHGSGDDNVHYLNSAALLDRLTSAKVGGFRFRMFTDSAHSMAVRGAYLEVFAEMTRFLNEKFGTKSGTI